MTVVSKNKKVAVLLSSVGFHWEEVAAAVQVFTQNECEVQFFTPGGKPPEADPQSLPVRKLLSSVGFGSPTELSPSSEWGMRLWARLKQASSVLDLNPKEFSALYIAGGHGCLFDINSSPAVHNRVLDFFQSGKILGAVCHATSTFAFVQQRGVPIVEGKRLTGFPNALDQLLVQWGAVDPRFLPIPFSNDGKLISAGAYNRWPQRMLAMGNPRYHVVDLPFITGVGPKAAAPVAQSILDHL
jgi:putative intracellular protease/amidase